MNERLQCLEVSGFLGGFFPPDAKVERFSYPIITPAAARNIFRCIYSNPYQFEWRVHHIAMVNPAQYIDITTNEVSGCSEKLPVEKLRTQRFGRYLYRPCFRIWAAVRLWEPNEAAQIRHESIFIDRARKGKYRHRPYLGLRELVAEYRYVEPRDWLEFSPAPHNEDLGYMVYDAWDLTVRPEIDESGRIDRDATRRLPKPGRFLTFHAIIRDGWLTTPSLLGASPPRLPQPEELDAGTHSVP